MSDQYIMYITLTLQNIQVQTPKFHILSPVSNFYSHTFMRKSPRPSYQALARYFISVASAHTLYMMYLPLPTCTNQPCSQLHLTSQPAVSPSIHAIWAQNSSKKSLLTVGISTTGINNSLCWKHTRAGSTAAIMPRSSLHMDMGVSWHKHSKLHSWQ